MLSIKYISAVTFIVVGMTRLTGQSVSLHADVIERCDSIDVHFNIVTDLSGKTLQNYLWKFGDGNPVTSNSTSVVKRYNSPGVYYASVEMRLTDGSTVYSDTTRIFVRPKPNANFFVADTFKLGKLTYRFLSGKAPTDTIVYSYEWTLNPDSSGSYLKIHAHANYVTPGPGIHYTKRDTLLYAFAHSGADIMRLQVTDYFGCADTFQQRFFVSEELVIPQVFTPNGDGINDFFIVQTNGRTVFSFKVFSITGQLIFKSESPSIIWDGKMATGSDAVPGSYLYVIEAVSGEPVKRQAGFFMLLKERK